MNEEEVRELNRLRKNIENTPVIFSLKTGRRVHKGATFQKLTGSFNAYSKNKIEMTKMKIENFPNIYGSCELCDGLVYLKAKMLVKFVNIAFHNKPLYFCSKNHKINWIYLKQKFPNVSKKQLSLKFHSVRELHFLDFNKPINKDFLTEIEYLIRK